MFGSKLSAEQKAYLNWTMNADKKKKFGERGEYFYYEQDGSWYYKPSSDSTDINPFKEGNYAYKPTASYKA